MNTPEHRRVLATLFAIALAFLGADVLAPLQIERDLSKYTSQVVEWRDCAEDLLPYAEYREGLAAKSELTCATVLVPADYFGNSESPDFKLQLMKLHYPKAKVHLGSIFINPGGPGGSGIEQVQTSNFAPELLENYDFIGFDPRGVGASKLADSTELKCSNLLAYKAFFGSNFPVNQKELDRDLKNYKKYMDSCRKSYPYWWTLTTENVVRDIEIMRAAVTGEAPLNFLGTSYGTRLAAYYVSRFPEHVGKVVLDSPVSISQEAIEDSLKGLKADEDKLSELLDGYAEYAGITPDQAWYRLRAVKKKAENGQLFGYVSEFPIAEDEYGWMRTSNESLINMGISGLNYYPDAEASQYFNDALDSAYLHNDNSTFEYFALELYGIYYEDKNNDGLPSENEFERTNMFELLQIVNQLDYAPVSWPDSVKDDFEKRAKKIAPKWDLLESPAKKWEGEGEYDSWATIALNDSAIPDPPSVLPVLANSSGKPLLVIASIKDVVTPYTLAQDTAKRLGAPLISVKGNIHGAASYYDNTCINKVLVDYFVKGKAQNSVTCPSK